MVTAKHSNLDLGEHQDPIYLQNDYLPTLDQVDLTESAENQPSGTAFPTVAGDPL